MIAQTSGRRREESEYRRLKSENSSALAKISQSRLCPTKSPLIRGLLFARKQGLGLAVLPQPQLSPLDPERLTETGSHESPSCYLTEFTF